MPGIPGQGGPDSSRRFRLFIVSFVTFVRFPLVLVFLTFAVINSQKPEPWLFAVALTSLITAALTDLIDGYLARKFEVVTELGAHADPLMDKFFYVSTLPLLVFVSAQHGNVGHSLFLLMLTVLFLLRDLWVTFLRSIGSIYNETGGANWSGKLRTAINFPVICAIYHFEEAPHNLIPSALLYAGEIAALAVTILSIVIYTRRYAPSLKRSAHLKQKGQDGKTDG
mgnify:CR=1 FL=1